jgi:hypothetical protein
LEFLGDDQELVFVFFELLGDVVVFVGKFVEVCLAHLNAFVFLFAGKGDDGFVW